MEKLIISEVNLKKKRLHILNGGWKFQIGYHNLKGLNILLNHTEKYENDEKHKIRKICLTYLESGTV